MTKKKNKPDYMPIIPTKNQLLEIIQNIDNLTPIQCEAIYWVLTRDNVQVVHTIHNYGAEVLSIDISPIDAYMNGIRLAQHAAYLASKECEKLGIEDVTDTYNIDVFKE